MDNWLDKLETLLISKITGDIKMHISTVARGDYTHIHIQAPQLYRHFTNIDYRKKNSLYEWKFSTYIHVFITENIKKGIVRGLMLSIYMNGYYSWYLKFDKVINEYYIGNRKLVIKEYGGKHNTIIKYIDVTKDKDLDELIGVASINNSGYSNTVFDRYMCLYIITTKKLKGEYYSGKLYILQNVKD